MAKVTRISVERVETTASAGHPLVTICLFCGAGLLLSLSVMLLDKYIPGDWF